MDRHGHIHLLFIFCLVAKPLSQQSSCFVAPLQNDNVWRLCCVSCNTKPYREAVICLLRALSILLYQLFFLFLLALLYSPAVNVAELVEIFTYIHPRWMSLSDLQRASVVQAQTMHQVKSLEELWNREDDENTPLMIQEGKWQISRNCSVSVLCLTSP